MKLSLLFLLLLTAMTQVYALDYTKLVQARNQFSFETDLDFDYFLDTVYRGQLFKNDNGQIIVPNEKFVVWDMWCNSLGSNDFMCNSVIAITKDEKKNLSKQNQESLINERAKAICRLTGYNGHTEVMETNTGNFDYNGHGVARLRTKFVFVNTSVIESEALNQAFEILDYDQTRELISFDESTIIEKDKSIKCKLFGKCNDKEVLVQNVNEEETTELFTEIYCGQAD